MSDTVTKGHFPDGLWKVWLLTEGDPMWYTAGKLVFLTEDDAVEHARDKFRNWSATCGWVVLPDGIDPHSRWPEGTKTYPHIKQPSDTVTKEGEQSK